MTASVKEESVFHSYRNFLELTANLSECNGSFIVRYHIFCRQNSLVFLYMYMVNEINAVLIGLLLSHICSHSRFSSPVPIL